MGEMFFYVFLLVLIYLKTISKESPFFSFFFWGGGVVENEDLG